MVDKVVARYFDSTSRFTTIEIHGYATFPTTFISRRIKNPSQPIGRAAPKYPNPKSELSNNNPVPSSSNFISLGTKYTAPAEIKPITAQITACSFAKNPNEVAIAGLTKPYENK